MRRQRRGKRTDAEASFFFASFRFGSSPPFVNLRLTKMKPKRFGRADCARLRLGEAEAQARPNSFLRGAKSTIVEEDAKKEATIYD
jgi:hypothetical protein